MQRLNTEDKTKPMVNPVPRRQNSKLRRQRFVKKNIAKQKGLEPATTTKPSNKVQGLKTTNSKTKTSLGTRY